MKEDIHKHVRKLLENDYEGFVLVTCRTATLEGNMQVEMTYDGDPVLASYLVHGAQMRLEEESLDPNMELMS